MRRQMQGHSKRQFNPQKLEQYLKEVVSLVFKVPCSTQKYKFNAEVLWSSKVLILA